MMSATAEASQVNVPVTAINTVQPTYCRLRRTSSHAHAGVSVAQKQLAAAQAVARRQAEANYAKAQDDVNRYKQLGR